jgi:hypothetical protein
MTGTELKKLLSWFRISDEAGCQCASRALIMDAWGPDETERRMEEVVGWLREAASQRGLPFLDFAARVVIRMAIHNARRSSLRDRRPEVAVALQPAEGLGGRLDGMGEAKGPDQQSSETSGET